MKTCRNCRRKKSFNETECMTCANKIVNKRPYVEYRPELEEIREKCELIRQDWPMIRLMRDEHMVREGDVPEYTIPLAHRCTDHMVRRENYRE